ncbi:DUF6445 family protein [Sphingomonas sp. 4RDLI-65]|uniref:DUF6445 family protein n=1 Tax=Sphingomonas sp. 4RDLI-65 TaxID=3111641 RepID=UPI003C28F4E0
MMTQSITRRQIGNEAEPLVVIDGFASDPDALRTAAAEAVFVSAGQHYPGIRAALPDTYLRDQLPLVARALGREFGPCRRIRVVDAQFSIVTMAPDALDIRQRLPHVDAYGRDRIALIHYLSPTNRDGTAFFRHRDTGFETIDETRAPVFFERLGSEIAAAPPQGYIADDTALFERTALVDAAYNRALLYRSYVLHSGAIADDAVLWSDPAVGRLTITAFLAIE